MCCVQNETKQTKCAKTFQTVWLLYDRGGGHIREKKQRKIQQTKTNKGEKQRNIRQKTNKSCCQHFALGARQRIIKGE